MRFEITEYDNGDPYSAEISRNNFRPNNPILISADRYELRTVGSDYGTTTVVSFFRGENEVATLFRLPRMIRVLDEIA